MTIASATSRISYVGDGSTTAFAVPFLFQSNADLTVMLQSSTGVQTTLVLGTGYSLSGAGVTSGGTCTFTVAPTALTGAVITIFRDPPVTQTTSYNNNDPFPAKSHENALDKVTMLEQRTRDMISRSVRLPDSDPALSTQLPTLALRANKLLGFDGGGLPVAVLGPSFVGGTYIGVADISTKSVAAVTVFPPAIIFLRTGGGVTPGDGLAGNYIKGTGVGAFTDGGGTSWVPVPSASQNAAFVESRAVAMTTLLQGTPTVISTGGYATAGDGGNATFKRVPAGTPFIDTWPTAGTIAGGSAYTNGTYFGIFLTGSATGSGLVATITVSGGAVTGIDYSCQPGNAYKVGDILTCANTTIGGTGAGFSYTLTTVSAPLASFANTIDGSLWQYVPDRGCTHVNQFGAKPDWVGTDGTATNNFAAIQAALFFGARTFGVSTPIGLEPGDIVRCGVGGYMVLHPVSTLSLTVPNGVYLEGIMGSTIKFSDSWNAALNCLNLGNPNAHFANFNCGLRNIQLFSSPLVSASSSIYMVYSNNMQDGSSIERVYLQCGQRGGIHYEIGYGGASVVKFHDLNIAINSVTPAFTCSVGTTIVDCQRWSLGGPSSGTLLNNNAINLSGNGGCYSFDGVHFEQFPTGFIINLLTGGNSPMASFRNINGGGSMVWLFILTGTNAPGSCSFERCQSSASGGLVQNGQSGGTNRTAAVLPKDGIVFFNP